MALEMVTRERQDNQVKNCCLNKPSKPNLRFRRKRHDQEKAMEKEGNRVEAKRGKNDEKGLLTGELPSVGNDWKKR